LNLLISYADSAQVGLEPRPGQKHRNAEWSQPRDMDADFVMDEDKGIALPPACVA
jgi:hypothetical protein